MEYFIVAYRSRTVTVRVYNVLRSRGVNCYLVNTPRSANVGCGLSVKLNRDAVESYVGELSRQDSFAGIFCVKNIGGKTVVVRL